MRFTVPFRLLLYNNSLDLQKWFEFMYICPESGSNICNLCRISMERYAMQFLKDWKKRGNRKPLIIRGARQVGNSRIPVGNGSETIA